MSSPLKQNTATIQNLINKINSLPSAGGSVDLPELANEGSASDLLYGKEFIDADGNKVIGTMPNNGAISSTMDGITIKSITIQEGYTSGGTVSLDNTIDNEVEIQEDLIAQITTVLENKAVGGGEQATPVISVNASGLITATAGNKNSTYQLTTQEAKTVTPSTSSQTAVAKGVYTTGAVTVAAMPTATQATPSISVSSSGLITASATQTAGYVSAGTKSGTKQLTTQAAKTITPTKSSQTAVSSGVYTTGAVTVAAIPSEYITTTDATATASEIFSGKTAYAQGSKITGTFTIDNELNTQTGLISQIETALVDKSAGGSSSMNPNDLGTCSIKVSFDATSDIHIACTILVNGVMKPCHVLCEGSDDGGTALDYADKILTNVLCGSPVIIASDESFWDMTFSNLTLFTNTDMDNTGVDSGGVGSGTFVILVAPTSSGSYAEIDLY